VTVANMTFVTPNYFRTMGIPVLKGRDFSPADLLPDGPRPKLVSESFARKYFPNEDPVGKRLGGVGGKGVIIGVVKNTLESGLETQPEPHIYHAGVSGLRDVSIVLRTSREPSSLASALRQEVLALDKEQPLSGIRPLKQIIAASVAERRFQMLLLTLFAVGALFLAAVGLYGVMAHMVTQRTHEIGVRMALGAQHRDVLRLVIGRGMTLVMAGLAIGIAAAIAVTQLLTHQLFGVTAADPVTYGSVSLLFVTIGLLACWLPARRAAKVDPMEALRYE
jgi:putative ABC transport system permease protein